MCIKICRWNIFGDVSALLATIYMYIYIYIYIIIIIYLYNTSTNAEMHERGGPPVPLTVGVDFAALLLVHVGRVEWVKVSRYM